MAREKPLWQDAKTSKPPHYQAVHIWLEHGEKGNGQMAIARWVSHDDGSGNGAWWSWGGPNAGNDFDNDDVTHWLDDLPKSPQGWDNL